MLDWLIMFALLSAGACLGYIFGATLARRSLELESADSPYHIDRVRCSECGEVHQLRAPDGYQLMLVKKKLRPFTGGPFG